MMVFGTTCKEVACARSKKWKKGALGPSRQEQAFGGKGSGRFRFLRWKIWVLNKNKIKRKEIKRMWDNSDGDCLLFRQYREEPELFAGIEYFE